MKIVFLAITVLSTFLQSNPQVRDLHHNGAVVKTTFLIDEKFYGKYQGSKEGFLLLNRDGSGMYNYDYAALSKTCETAGIEIDWGFIVDEHNEVVRFERPYGFSYPIIYNCSGASAFRNCTQRTMIDYVLVYNDGTITISSSDDWKKQRESQGFR